MDLAMAPKEKRMPPDLCASVVPETAERFAQQFASASHSLRSVYEEIDEHLAEIEALSGWTAHRVYLLVGCGEAITAEAEGRHVVNREVLDGIAKLEDGAKYVDRVVAAVVRRILELFRKLSDAAGGDRDAVAAALDHPDDKTNAWLYIPLGDWEKAEKQALSYFDAPRQVRSGEVSRASIQRAVLGAAQAELDHASADDLTASPD